VLTRNSDSDDCQTDNHRGYVKKAGTSIWRVGDRVWLVPGGSSPWKGPYLVASVVSPGKYKLCSDDDKWDVVNDGNEVPENQLTKASS